MYRLLPIAGNRVHEDDIRAWEKSSGQRDSRAGARVSWTGLLPHARLTHPVLPGDQLVGRVLRLLRMLRLGRACAGVYRVLNMASSFER